MVGILSLGRYDLHPVNQLYAPGVIEVKYGPACKQEILFCVNKRKIAMYLISNFIFFETDNAKIAFRIEFGIGIQTSRCQDISPKHPPSRLAPAVPNDQKTHQ